MHPAGAYSMCEYLGRSRQQAKTEYEMREKKKVTLEKLGAGLCDPGKLSRIESGKVQADKLLQNRLLERLGVAEENYENFLYYSDYKVWKERQNIVHEVIKM